MLLEDLKRAVLTGYRCCEFVDRRLGENAGPNFPSQSSQVSLLIYASSSALLLTADSAFKMQLKAMLIDPSLNSVATILANVHQSFYEAAVRCLEYARMLSKVRTTCSSLLISTSSLSYERAAKAVVGGRSLWRRLSLPIMFANAVAETVDNMIALAYVMLQRRSRSRASREATIMHGVISRRQLQW